MSEQPATTNTDNQSAMLPMRTARPWRRILLGVIILVCGIAIGAGGSAIILRNALRTQMLHAMRHPERAPAAMVERMQRELHLSPKQAEQVEAIITQRFLAIEQIREKTRPRIDEQLGLMKEEVLKVLDKAQGREWLKGLEKFRRIPPPPPPHPPPLRGPPPPPRSSPRTPGR